MGGRPGKTVGEVGEIYQGVQPKFGTSLEFFNRDETVPKIEPAGEKNILWGGEQSPIMG